MLTWSIIFRALYVLMAPIFIFAIVISGTPFLFHLIHPEDLLREKITNAARSFSFARRFQSDDRTLTLFNEHFYVATRAIGKSETIKAADLEREFYGFKGPPGRGMLLSQQDVVFSKAAQDIAKDQLIVAADLVPGNSAQKNDLDLDRDVKTAGPRLEMSFPVVVFASVLLGTGALAWGYGYLAIAMLAFRRSILWGLSSIFIPFASVVFKLQNWAQSKRYFHAILIGYALVSLGGMLFIIHFEQPLRW